MVNEGGVIKAVILIDNTFVSLEVENHDDTVADMTETMERLANVLGGTFMFYNNTDKNED